MITLTCTHTTVMYHDWVVDGRTASQASFADYITTVGVAETCNIGFNYNAIVGWLPWRAVFHFEKNFDGYVKIDDFSPSVASLTVGVHEPAQNSVGDRDEVRCAFMYDMNTASGDNILAVESWNDFGWNTQSNSITFNTLADPMLKTITWPTSTDTNDNRTNRFKIEDYLNRTDQTHVGIMMFGAQDWSALEVDNGGSNTEPDAAAQIMITATHAYTDATMRPQLFLNASLATQRPMF